MYSTIKEYFDKKYGKEYIQSIDKLSNSQSEKAMVKGDFWAYSLDAIFQQERILKNLHSVDAVIPYDDKLVLIEFKSGFEDRINKTSFSYEQYRKDIICDAQKKECEKLVNFSQEYYELRYKNRKLEKSELL